MSVLLRPCPQPVAPRPWSFPRFERTCLSNGMAVLLCHLPDRPVVEVRVVLPGGARRDPVGAEGTARVAGAALFEGTARRDVERFNVAVEELGAYVQAELHWDALVPALSVPGARLAPALDLLLEALAEPGFRDEDVARVVGLHRDRLALSLRYPGTRADAAFSDAAFVGTRRALPLGGSPASVGTLTPPAVRAFWREVVDPAGATVVVVGDLRDVPVERLLDQGLGTWSEDGSGSTPAVPALPEVVRPGGRVTVVHLPGAVQSHLVVGQARPPLGLFEQAGLNAAVHYLGGFFSSRLMSLLREEKGVTYGVSARAEHGPAATTVRVDTAVQRDATAEAAADVLRELRTAVAGEIEPGLFGSAVEHLLRTAPTRYQSPDAVASWLVQVVVNGRPDDFFDLYRDGLSATTADSAAAVLARHVDSSALSVVVVGDADHVADGLAALGHGLLTVEPA